MEAHHEDSRGEDPPPSNGQIFIRDDAIKSFSLRVTANGVKSFVWEGRINGRPRRDTLGKFPDLTVLEARAKALDYKARIARGENPVAERDRERDALREEKTFAQLIDDFMNLHAKPHKKSWREDQGLLARYLPASWKTRRLSEFTHDEIVRLHQKIGQENARSSRSRCDASASRPSARCAGAELALQSASGPSTTSAAPPGLSCLCVCSTPRRWRTERAAASCTSRSQAESRGDFRRFNLARVVPRSQNLTRGNPLAAGEIELSTAN